MFFGIELVLGAWSWDATSNASYPFWGHLSVSNPMMFLSSTPLCPSLCLTWGNFFILLKFLLDNLRLAFLLNLHDSFSFLLFTRYWARDFRSFEVDSPMTVKALFHDSSACTVHVIFRVFRSIFWAVLSTQCSPTIFDNCYSRVVDNWRNINTIKGRLQQFRSIP